MPVYAYECKECGVRFERRQSFNDDPITICPECEGEVRRLIQPAGIVFKGSGFYVTDNRSSSNPTIASKSDSTSKSADTSASTEKKADSTSTTSKSKKKKD
jgi:putative FmdB family regulatory protein